MLTYQDFERAEDKVRFVESAIASYKQSQTYKTAVLADEYDGRRNPTIRETIRAIYNVRGAKVEDHIASNHRIACNFFNRLNTQRCMYSLGNGVSFVGAGEGGEDATKAALGPHFDHTIKEAGYYALIHGVAYLFWDMDTTYYFTAKEFVPLADETDGRLRAGIRFWQLDRNRPLNAVLYEADGYTKMAGTSGKLEVTQEKTAYKVTYQYTEAGETTVLSEENYPSLPVIRMYGSRLRQSTLVGMQEAIDAYDLIKSGFANDLADCAQIYWLVENYGGMTDEDLATFLDRLKLNHVASADTQSGGRITPYTQEVPYQARQALLAELRDGLYEDFGALDVHTVAAGSTNDHIDAAYQPLDENAADFEHWVGDAITQLLSLQGIEDEPVFKRQRISNQKEQVEMLVQEAAWLDEATILRKLPNLSPAEAQSVLDAEEAGEMARLGMAQPVTEE